MDDRKRPALAWPIVGILAAIKLGAHLYAIQGYGIFRDELYYLACAEHLDWGYVDHPMLSIVVLWLVKGLLGTSLFALRLIPALAGVAALVLVAATARRLGGGALAQALAAAAVLVAPHYLAIGHIYSMNALALLLWSATAYLAVGLVDDATPRRWLVLAVVLALGLANKIDFLWLGAGLGVALLVGPERRWLATRWPWLTGVLSMLGLLPYLLWQLAHGWPTLEFVHNATTQKMVSVSPLDFLSGQVDSMHLFTVPITLAGLVYLLTTHRGRRYQLLAWTFLTVAVLLIASGSSRSGYLAPAYTWIFPAGGVAFEAVLSHWRIRWPGWAYLFLLLVGGAVVAPFALPVLPIDGYIRYAERLGVTPSTEEKKEVAILPQFYADMHGWREITATVAQVVESLPVEERARARVFAPDYGIAGAIDYYGPAAGLAPSLSGHNNYWLWPPEELPDPMIVIGGARDDLEPLFEQVEGVGALDCGFCMPYENGRPIWLCRRPRMTVDEVWPRVVHFD